MRGGIPDIWVHRTAPYNARRLKKNREKIRPINFEEDLLLKFSPIPCWAHLSPEEYQQRVRDLVEEIEKETAARHLRNGTHPLGHRAVLDQHPHHRPNSVKKSPAPKVHAATKKARKKFLDTVRIFLRAYQEASASLRSGNLAAEFPDGCFPPRGPFIEPRGAPAAL